MKLKSKLIVGFVAIMMLLLIISAAGLNNFTKVDDKLDEVYTNRYQKLMLAYDLHGAVNNQAKGLVNVLTVPTAETLKQNRQLLDDSSRQAQDFLDRLKESASSDTERTMVLQLERNLDRFFAYGNQVTALIEGGKSSQAVALRQNEGLDDQEATVNLIDDISDFHRRAMDEAVAEAKRTNRMTQSLMLGISVVGLLLGLGVMIWNLSGVTFGLNGLTALIAAYARGALDPAHRRTLRKNDEFGEVAKAFYSLAEDLQRKTEIEQSYNRRMEDEAWITSNLAAVTAVMQAEQEIPPFCQSFLEQLVPLAGAAYGGLYVRDDLGDGGRLTLRGGYAVHDEALFDRSFAFGEGLVGQCARSMEPIALTELPPDYIKLRSGSGEARPGELLLVPIAFERRLLAVLELACVHGFDERQRKLIEELGENCGISLNNLFGRLRVAELLRESRAMSEELQVQSEELMSQQEELRKSNDELEEQTRALKKSEEQLQLQQEELEQSNEELTQKTHLLELQMHQTEEKNRQIEKTKVALEKQTVQLALSSKYKSEFLANMSHELRTPLNSLLILSQMLKDNKEGNLTDRQVDFASTIHSSGSDLLKLIDEILDLSKIGAGKMNIVAEQVTIGELADAMREGFAALSQQKGLRFAVRIEAGVPEGIYTDGHRVKQILKNLLANAFKFTRRGSVGLAVRPVGPKDGDIAAGTGAAVAFEVSDTGIGIPEEKRQIIFEAFQQVDGTTSRTYGGTGLGLAISRDLAELLGGEIRLESEVGKGSVFTLYLPEYPAARDNDGETEADDEPVPGRKMAAPAAPAAEATRQAAPAFAPAIGEASAPASAGDSAAAAQLPAVEDDRDSIESADRVVLIIEDDVHFARVLLDIARSRGFKGIVALRGDEGLELARARKPDAVLLDMMLPVMDGWSVLHHLKHDPDTQHIPVHVVSVMDDIRQGLSMGAIAYLTKPATKERIDRLFQQIESFLERDLKQLLVVEDDAAQRIGIMELIGHDDVAIKAVSSGREALDELAARRYDCMVLDLGLPDIDGFELLDNIRRDSGLREMPIVIYTGRALDKKEELRLKKFAETILIKDVKSPERLLDETTLFLHRVVANLPEEKRSVLRKLHSVEAIFEGKPVLIVDDDIRNVFALSSALEGYNMDILFAENGREALEALKQRPDIKLILMDMMMREMDGYETMRHIRRMPEFEQLPIIAITAKAMKEDRDKCIEAGAFDYIAKPVNIDQLLSLMRVWLYQ